MKRNKVTNIMIRLSLRDILIQKWKIVNYVSWLTSISKLLYELHVMSTYYIPIKYIYIYIERSLNGKVRFA